MFQASLLKSSVRLPVLLRIKPELILAQALRGLTLLYISVILLSSWVPPHWQPLWLPLVTHVYHTPATLGPWHLPGTLFFALINSLLTPSSWFTLRPKLYLLREACAELSYQITLLLMVSQSTASLPVLALLAVAPLHFFVWLCQ